MPTHIERNELLLRCSCGDVDHVAWLVHDLKEPATSWYLMTSLDRNFSLWRRLKTALKYTLKPRSVRYCGYSELVLTERDIDALVSFVRQQRS